MLCIIGVELLVMSFWLFCFSVAFFHSCWKILVTGVTVMEPINLTGFLPLFALMNVLLSLFCLYWYVHFCLEIVVCGVLYWYQGSFWVGFTQWETTLQCNVVSHWLNHTQNDPCDRTVLYIMRRLMGSNKAPLFEFTTHHIKRGHIFLHCCASIMTS